MVILRVDILLNQGFLIVFGTRLYGFVKTGVAVATLVFASLTTPAMALSDEELKRGFFATVFGSEITRFGIQYRYVHKFSDVVRFRIHNLSAKNRTQEARRFINSLESKISGLKVRIVNAGEAANFNLYIVDRENYGKTIRERVERRPNARARGKCLVKSRFSRAGMIRSDAVIVSDEGDALFQRCLIEEILQGLGPLNESTELDKSVFNDTSKHIVFTDFDRVILNMLYDRRIRNGVGKRSVAKVLDTVLRDTRRRLGL